jgi:2-methylcitrate dehydratase PrpD
MKAVLMSETTMPTLPEDALLQRLVQLQQRPVSAATRERLAQALLDWFTAGWSGLALPAADRLRTLASTCVPGTGPAPVFGGGLCQPLAAAMANAGIAHLREVDDAHRAAMLHPGVVAITPVLALAAAQPLPQRRVVDAIVAGYEVALRLGEALGTRHAAAFHATATAGSVGAAAAAGVALGLQGDTLHHALGIAATQSAGLWQLVDDGAHEAKSLHPAFAVRNGMTAAWAAQLGLPGARAFVSGARGLHPLLGGDGPLAVLAPAAANEPERLHTTTIKAWPCCAQLFTPLDALRALMLEHGIGAADVAALQVTIFPHALKIAGVHWPATAAEAPFCLRYLLATLLVHGRVGVEHTERPALDDPALQALAGRITVHTDDTFQHLFPHRRPARVDLALHDGRQLTARRDLRRGDPEDPFDGPALLQRLRDFAPALDDRRAALIERSCRSVTDPALDAQPAPVPATVFGAAE